MSKKLKLSQLHQSRGDIITDEPSNLDTLNKSQSHKISLAAQYLEKLSTLDLDDLQNLALELGIAGTDNRDSLIKAIKRALKN
jgi:hypothetical protein